MDGIPRTAAHDSAQQPQQIPTPDMLLVIILHQYPKRMHDRRRLPNERRIFLRIESRGSDPVYGFCPCSSVSAGRQSWSTGGADARDIPSATYGCTTYRRTWRRVLAVEGRQQVKACLGIRCLLRRGGGVWRT